MRTALMATAPSAALFGFTGMHQPTLLHPVVASARAPEAAPVAVEASYYGDDFAGRPTASGETFNPEELTAAHRTLPFDSLVRVTDAVTGKSVVVRVNDRGPFHGNREIDLSTAAAREIGMLASGTAKVTLDLVGRG